MEDPVSDPVTAVSLVARVGEAAHTQRVELLYREHRDLVYRLALRYGGGNGAWAEDVTQEVFLRLFEVVDRLEDREGLEAWFYRVTSNRCLNRLRAERIRNSAPVRWLLGKRAQQPEDPENLTAVREELRQAWTLLQTLPPKERVAFSMHYIDGKKQNEIARILGHSKGYVCKLIKKAETRVREAGWEVEGV
jgi:RNA polymerase sigma-70 factor (ECF subfamily)